MQFSEKQRALARAIISGEGRFYWVSGPTRAGKTEAALRPFLHRTGSRFSGHQVGIVTRSRAQDRLVVRPKIMAWAAQHNLRVTPREHHIEIEDAHGGHNDFVPLIAADSDQLGERVQGMGLSGLYVDEFTRIPQDFYKMCTSRCIETPNTPIIMTMNPDDPGHWAKVKYGDRIDKGELNGKTFQFAMSDNPLLSPEAIAEIAESYGIGTPFHRRMVMGEWCAAEGLVYPNVTYADAPPAAEHWRYEVSFDWAASSVTVALLWAFTSEGVHCIDEWVHDGRTAGPMPPSEQAEAIWRWATGNGTQRSVASWIIPRDAHGLCEWFDSNAAGQVWEAVDEMLFGIGQSNVMLASGEAKIDPRCVGLRGDNAAYRWRERQADEGTDMPDKRSADGAHYADAMRYALATWRRALGFGA